MLGGDQTRAPQRHQAFRRIKRSLNQNLRGASRFVVFSVRNQVDFFLFDITLWRNFAARHPERQRALIRSLAVIQYGCCNTVRAALLRFESAFNSIRSRLLAALLLIGLVLTPLAFFEDPIEQYQLQFDRPPSDCVPIYIGSD